MAKKGYVEAVRLLKKSGLSGSKMISGNFPVDNKDLLPLNSRIKKILGIINDDKRVSTDMLFFVMYDIEDNRIRRYIVKYLERKGCIRIQKSIFLADLPVNKFEEIKKDFAEVNDCYDNHDSIILAPISTDYLCAMKMIGNKIDLDLFLKKRNTLFF